MKAKTIFMQGMDGTILIKKDVAGFYMIGLDIVVLQFIDGSEFYYTNYKVIGTTN